MCVIFGCRMVEVPSVEVKENDICVKMLAAPINPSDINRIQGCVTISIQFILLCFSQNV